ncbi:hypothetical protein BB559_003942 [Furculomyces boomerangus]|uniref:Uncharacterized protein n=1 Tax=Furculomyces boomerangus TaxID=61424 RepID=A0A2T9YHQ9_9FUNG|nr:hypothetical protein BB559_003942 [Furculomyces boomerangus]
MEDRGNELCRARSKSSSLIKSDVQKQEISEEIKEEFRIEYEYKHNSDIGCFFVIQSFIYKFLILLALSYVLVYFVTKAIIRNLALSQANSTVDSLQ